MLPWYEPPLTPEAFTFSIGRISVQTSRQGRIDERNLMTVRGEPRCKPRNGVRMKPTAQEAAEKLPPPVLL
jgi:hypothetical protein